MGPVSRASHQAELDVALPAIALACKLTAQVQGEVEALEKSDGSPVTLADFASQAAVMHSLGSAFPADRFISEESASTPRSDPALLDAIVALLRGEIPEADGEAVCRWIDSGRRSGDTGRHWLLDPLDGTKGFLAGGQYAVALALIEDGTPACVLLGCPNLGPQGALQILAATRAGGAWIDRGGPIRVSDRADPRAVRVVQSRVRAHSHLALQQRICQEIGLTETPAQLDSQAKYALVATGRAEVFLRLPHPDQPDYLECGWDHAAGALLVECAGGRVTDMTGAPLDFSHGERLRENRGIVATNGGAVHDALLRAIARVTA